MHTGKRQQTRHARTELPAGAIVANLASSAHAFYALGIVCLHAIKQLPFQAFTYGSKYHQVLRNHDEASITKNAPYAWGNFHTCAITRFQKPQQLSWAGRGQRARRSPRAQRAETRSQQPALLQTAAETTAACWWINWQRRLEVES